MGETIAKIYNSVLMKLFEFFMILMIIIYISSFCLTFNIAIYKDSMAEFSFKNGKVLSIELNEGRGYTNHVVKATIDGKIKTFFAGMSVSPKERDIIVKLYRTPEIFPPKNILVRIWKSMNVSVKFQKTYVFENKKVSLCVSEIEDSVYMINYIDIGISENVSDAIYIGQDEDEKIICGIGDFSPPGVQVIGNSLMIPAGAGYFLTYYREGGMLSKKELGKIRSTFLLKQTYPPLKK